MGKGPGGKINRPKTELGRSLLKRRRVLRHEKRKKHLRLKAGVNAGLTTTQLLKKINSNLRANVILSGKKKRKLHKHLKHANPEKEKVVAQKSPAAIMPRPKKRDASQDDVEMADME
ncbi:hypothetical protein UPYG_G00274180 [Umbra pygmaea]|uniref:Uncharacterized protein n=1 Tax=Umbra pygmaea TaxID=75934 RepID=A0ABD0WQM0_UMBPY